MLTDMLLPYRLDLHVDLFEINVADTPVLLNQDELERVCDEIQQVEACWPEPKPAQLWAAITRGLGRDPREDRN